jgi:hypothetical protein
MGMMVPAAMVMRGCGEQGSGEHHQQQRKRKKLLHDQNLA